MRITARMVGVGAVALFATLAISASVETEPTVTGTVTQVEEYTLYIGSPPAPYTLTTITAMDEGLLYDTFPQNLLGRSVSVTYQTVDGQNYVLALQVLPDEP